MKTVHIYCLFFIKTKVYKTIKKQYNKLAAKKR